MIAYVVLLFICWVMIGYLSCRVAYNQGRNDRWQEVARDYIVFHKDVKIKPHIVTVGYEGKGKDIENKKVSNNNKSHNNHNNHKKHLTNKKKKSYNKTDKKVK